MFDENLSNELWSMLEERVKDFFVRLYSFSKDVKENEIRIETFSVWRRLNNGRREKERDYYRIVRNQTGRVLYDQLEDVLPLFIEKMHSDKLLIPDIRISPNRANKLLHAALKEQEEIDRLIAEEK